MKTQDVYALLSEVKKEIDRKLMVRRDAFSSQIIDPYEVEIENREDPNEIQKRNALFGLLYKLEDVTKEMEYLSLPIVDCGVLQRNGDGRFELNGHEFTSGRSIEILVEDPEGEEPSYWEHTRIEHDTDYYAVSGHRRLDGLIARYR